MARRAQRVHEYFHNDVSDFDEWRTLPGLADAHQLAGRAALDDGCHLRCGILARAMNVQQQHETHLQTIGGLADTDSQRQKTVRPCGNMLRHCRHPLLKKSKY